MEEKSVKLEIELDRESVQTTCFLQGLKLTDEMWNELLERPVKLNFEDMGGNVMESKVAFAALAISKVLHDMEKSHKSKLQALLDEMIK